MPRDYRLYLDDILDSIRKVETYLKDMTFEQFADDQMRIDAVVRNLEIIGEAVKNISPEIQAKYPQIEWRNIAGFRDIAVHEYFGITLKIVWAIYQDDLSLLRPQVIAILEQENDGDSA